MGTQGLFQSNPGTLLNPRIPNSVNGGYWPHEVWVAIPLGNPKLSWVILPGGGGFAGQQARYLNVLLNGTTWVKSNVNWPLLGKFGGIVGIFVSPRSIVGVGQVYSVNLDGSTHLAYAAGANPQNPNDYSVPGATVFGNGYEISGVDDVQFLLDLKAWAATPGNLPASVAGIHLGGHSSGAMMTTAMWWLHPEAYNHHVTWAGPPNVNWFGARSYPATQKPKLDIQGEDDDVVGALNYQTFESQLYADFWDQNPANFNQSDALWPNLTQFIGGWKHYSDRLVAAGLPAPDPNAGVVNGNLTTHATADNKQQFVSVKGATHQFASITAQVAKGSLWNSAAAWFIATASP